MASTKKAPKSAGKLAKQQVRDWKQAMQDLKKLNRKLAAAMTALEDAQDGIDELTKKYPGGPGNILNKTKPARG
jgi:hypothetical protein